VIVLESPCVARIHARLAALAALVCMLMLAAAGPARADTPATLTVVGTSDVQDSGLMPQLIKPMFESAYPQFTLKYVSVGTGVAINDAESGVASALLVHAASLENQFVAQGFSQETYGRAIFYGDYVLLGPASDPAGVLSGAPHDIAGAFALIAAAGAAGKADFVSRGGTPGTTVQEHAIWALGAGTPGLTMCDVSAANGGGEAPSTASGPCPTTTANPSWYHTTGLTQGPNIEAANTCNFTNATSRGGNDCYVITDRGTFACLASAACAGGSAAPGNLKIVTRDNSASAKGGDTLLINSFHAYAVDPAKFAGSSNVQINSTAAVDFLNFITSPSFQAQLRGFLGATSDPPFIADAAPVITASSSPSRVIAGTPITVTGKIVNPVPGTPALAGDTVTVSEVGSGLAAGVPVASGQTDPTGAFSITFSPPSTGRYQVSSGRITQVENRTLRPIFGDLLQPAATPASTITVQGVINGLSVTARPGGVLATGSLLPSSPHVKGTIALLARRGRRGAFRQIATESLDGGDHSFAAGASLKPGSWTVEARFQDPGQIVAATSKPIRIVVPARGRAGVRTTSFKLARGAFKLTGVVTPKPAASATSVQVLGLDLGAASAHFKLIATVKLHAGASTFTVHGKLRRGQRWVLQPRYAPGGAAGVGYGGLRTVRVT
jgi:tungstate transport system substrate-binding protein